jgi:hypothetical protein
VATFYRLTTTAGATCDTGAEVVARLTPANQVTRQETEMNRRLELFSIVLFALNAGVVGGGDTSSLADEAGVEVDLGDVRSAILSLFAPAGAVATEANPN